MNYRWISALCSQRKATRRLSTRRGRGAGGVQGFDTSDLEAKPSTMLLIKAHHPPRTRGEHTRRLATALLPSSFRIILSLLLLVLIASTLPTYCLADEELQNNGDAIGTDAVDEDDGGGGGGDGDGVDLGIQGDILMAGPPIPIPLYQNESYQIGNITVVGTSFNSTVNSTDLRVPVPVPPICGIAGEKTEQCGANPKKGRPVECCSGLICKDDDDHCIVPGNGLLTAVTGGGQVPSNKSEVFMFMGDSGGAERAAFHDNWHHLVDVGKGFKDNLVNLRVQHKHYTGATAQFKVKGGVNKFVILSSFQGVDKKNPIVDFKAGRFSPPPPLMTIGTDGNNWTNTAPSLALVAPSVQTVDGGVVVVMFLLHSDAGGPILTGIDAPAGFRVLSSDVSRSGESMSAFVGSAVSGGGCIEPEPIAADITTRSSGIVMSLSLRPLDGVVEDFFPPCDKEDLARWIATRNMERDALGRIYNETGGPDEEDGWKRRGGWLQPGVDHCYWEGVDCDVSGLVTSLVLTTNGLNGRLPSFDDLQNIAAVDFTNNNLGGGELDVSKLPASLAYINLSKNNFDALVGEIPATLRHLDLSENALAGTCCKAASPISNFTHINLAENRLDAIDVSSATNLQFLDISNNQQLNQPLSDLGVANLYHLRTLKLKNSPGRLTGDLNLGNLPSLTHLDVSGLGLEGKIDDTGIIDMVNLTHLDLSGGNNYSGYMNFCNYTNLEVLRLKGNNLHADIIGSGCDQLGSIRHVDLQGNNFTGFLGSISQQPKLEYVDLSYNSFYGSLPTDGLLLTLRYLDISNNLFTGPFPTIVAPKLQYINMRNNELRGTISPSIGLDVPILQNLDLSNQVSSVFDPSTGERITSGLSGQIPETIGRMRFLQTLKLSSNTLSGTIPESVAGLSYLNTLDLERNIIGGSMPATINILEQLNEVLLADNRLEGEIPPLSGARDKIRTVTLSGNPDLHAPAPFTLCDLDDLDLRSNDAYCPAERSALAKLHAETQGGEWINNDNWLTDVSHCLWYGVKCSEDGTKVLELSLVLNGVSGELPEEFYKLTNLKRLDLNDNDLRGTISSALGNMKSLEYLRLSYNIFTGSLPDSMDQLKNLQYIHLHGNRLTGTDSRITLAPPPPKDPDAEDKQYYFITDCGDPQDALSPFVCDGCDMCCNSLEECQEPLTQEQGPYASAAIVIGSVVGAMAFLWVVIHLLVKCAVVKLSTEGSNALEAVGDDSVYSFFLSSRKTGWFLTLFTLLIQAAIFVLFLDAADFSNDDGDFVYSFRCPRNVDNCGDERAVSSYGWVMWGFLVFASLLDDIANGIKLLLLSSSRGSTPCFICSLTLLSITVLAIYTSFYYNRAIAMTNTELIVNAVILLFVNDVDEQVFSIVKIFNSKWLNSVVDQAEAYSAELLEYNVSDEDGALAVKDIGSERANDEFSGVGGKVDNVVAAPLESALSNNGSKSDDDPGTDAPAQDQRTFWSTLFGRQENQTDDRKSIASSTGGNDFTKEDVTDLSHIDLVKKVEMQQQLLLELQKQMAEIQRNKV